MISKDTLSFQLIRLTSNGNRNIITETNISGAPDLVVEILSPSTADRDRELKLSLYTRFGVKEYWIVDPDNDVVQSAKCHLLSPVAVARSIPEPRVGDGRDGLGRRGGVCCRVQTIRCMESVTDSCHSHCACTRFLTPRAHRGSP